MKTTEHIPIYSHEIFNSDQGSQYTSNETIEILKNNISISMDAKGRCFYNIHNDEFYLTRKGDKKLEKSVLTNGESIDIIFSANIMLMNK